MYLPKIRNHQKQERRKCQPGKLYIKPGKNLVFGRFLPLIEPNFQVKTESKNGNLKSAAKSKKIPTAKKPANPFSSFRQVGVVLIVKYF